MVEYSPYAYEIHEDPYPIYAKLRAEAPVYRNDELDFWALALHEDVLAVLKLLDGEADSTAIYKVYEIIGDDLKRKIYMLASKDELKRFTGSLNHPSASGEKARHARLKSKPPKNPMTESEWRDFTETLANGWIKEKAAP